MNCFGIRNCHLNLTRTTVANPGPSVAGADCFNTTCYNYKTPVGLYEILQLDTFYYLVERNLTP